MQILAKSRPSQPQNGPLRPNLRQSGWTRRSLTARLAPLEIDPRIRQPCIHHDCRARIHPSLPPFIFSLRHSIFLVRYSIFLPSSIVHRPSVVTP